MRLKCVSDLTLKKEPEVLHRHNHLRKSCAMERERLLGAAAPVVEASTSGFALDGVVRTRRDRARLAAAVAALLGCAALAGSSLAGASVAALGDGDGPAKLGDAGEPNAWGTKHNALPWWSMPAAAASASSQAGLGVYAEDEATAAGDGDGGTDDETQPKPSADVLTATEPSAEPNEKLASGEDGEDVSGEDVSGEDGEDVSDVSVASLGTSPRAARGTDDALDDSERAARVEARRRERRRRREAQDALNEARAMGRRPYADEESNARSAQTNAHEAEARLGAGEPGGTAEHAEEDDDDIEVYAATEKERVARVAARRAARAAMRAAREKSAGGSNPVVDDASALGAARRADERERIRQGYAPLRGVSAESARR